MDRVAQAQSALPTDHGTFDQHYLRAFAHALPFYVRPALHTTQLSIQCFIEDFYHRLQPVLQESKQGSEMGALLRERGHVRQHIAFMFLEQCVHLHSGLQTLDQVLAYARHDLQRIKNGYLSLSSPYHPLYGNIRSKYVRSVYEVPMRVMDATVKDQKIAQFMKELPLEDSLPRVAAEYVSLSPDCRIHRYSVALLQALRTMLASKTFLDGEDREQLLFQTIEEWMELRSAQIGRTADTSINRNALNTLVNSLEQRVGIEDVSEVHDRAALRRMLPFLHRDAATCEEILPLLEQFIINCAADGDEECTVDIVEQVDDIVKKHRIVLCDHPGLGLANLSLHMRFSSKEAILRHINTQ